MESVMKGDFLSPNSHQTNKFLHFWHARHLSQLWSARENSKIPAFLSAPNDNEKVWKHSGDKIVDISIAEVGCQANS